ncbi:hypothetical protein LIER_40318 [Lithospermum erythrorhizon]|uniref:Transmembrane protein n=1 Tax=Lithospermum erythrorhizon TaxID=34254 RepID=A0AAV3QVX7_LITER
MATPPSPSLHTLTLYGVLSESKKILNAHSRHFLALSVLFLLPLSFSLIIYSTLHSLLNHPPHPHLSLSYTFPHLTFPPSHALFTILYALFALFMSLFAFASIGYSTFHGFYGRPVKIGASVGSILSSFLPLCGTLFVGQVVVGVVGLVFMFFGGLVYKKLELFGVGMSTLVVGYDISTWVCVFVVFMVGLFVIYLHVNWVLAPVVVVVESKWGYEALRRSAYLVRGMRGVALSMMGLFGLSIWFVVWAFSEFSRFGSVVNVGGVLGFDSVVFICETVINSGAVTLLMLEGMAGIVVLYMYCKAVHGELALGIAEEFDSEYISLPFDDEKVPHVVSVVYG